MTESGALRRAVAATLLPGFVGTALPGWLEARLRDGLGGVCVFGPNIESASQLRELTDAIYAANPGAIIAIDEEGGDVTRLYYATGSPLPGNAILGRIDDLDYTRSIARRIGFDVRRAGFNLNLAPDADVNSSPDNPVIGVRSFGTSPEEVAAQVSAWTDGLQSTAVAACAKHFPGHGDTNVDSHLALPVVNRSIEQLRERELVPFMAAIAAGTRAIMSSHILLPQLDADRPATLSRRILGDLLRGELGFTGLIASDALDMAGASGVIGIPEAAVRALDAGCDLLCIGSETTAEQLDEIEGSMLAAVAAGRLAADRVRDAASRVIALAEELSVARGDIPIPAADSELSESDARRALDSFAVQPGVRDTLARSAESLQIVNLDTQANKAIGCVPWGLSAELAADPARYSGTKLTARPSVSTNAPSGLTVDPHAVPVVIGRDIHRSPESRAVVDRLREGHPNTIVVDMGWPGTDRAYADVATFGGSRLAGRALADLLNGGAK
ncbi:MAG TPA: glycoside hydrolase family 3 protein [Galbitalea sp.]|nr:glycoside hydrolase family 3 protein [Galbitalea sp.]